MAPKAHGSGASMHMGPYSKQLAKVLQGGEEEGSRSPAGDPEEEVGSYI